jgi:predicted Rossmann-fold nucleotide-binding protein
VLDVDGYFEPLRALLDGAVRQGFVSKVHRELVITDDDPARLLGRLAAWTPVTTDKWLDPSER